MKKLLLILAITFVALSFSSAQKYATCNMAAEVNDNAFGPVAPSGAKDKEVTKRHSNGFYFEQSHNITWLSFVVPGDTLLTFDLVPQNPADNLDFLVFSDEDFFCNEIAKGLIKPIRANLASPDTTKHSGTTGLSANAKDTIVASGNGSCYCKAIMAKKGERYYIVVDNSSVNGGGFTLALHLKFPKYAPPPMSEDREMVTQIVNEEKTKVKNIDAAPYKAPRITSPSKGKTTLTIQVTDTADNPVQAEIDITGIKAGQIINVDSTQYTITLSPRQTININCNALGYMFNQASFTAHDTASNITFPIKLVRVVEHKSFILKDIKFREGNAVFLPTSQNELMNLLEFMKSNPDVHILIKGYVNDPGNGNSGAAKKLSKQRAQAVKDFLVAAGINKKRLGYKGFGNENMLFPNPATEGEAEANRRVEIEIVK